MAKAIKEPPVTEKIEIVDQPDEQTKKRGFFSRLPLPLILVAAAVGIFFLVRRFSSNEN
ncbi:MAG TPA: hypothetical protein VKX46_02785 [Ktedonobacteraceae bacterium]|nr:hypothetical protein [Ktedonobacteraceae bacterium]